MSNDLNNCSFIGRLGSNCEGRYMPSGEAVASFSIAVGSQWKNKAGEKQESTEWVNITAFGKLGEICIEYLKKGSQVFVSGRMKTEKYTDKSGIEKYATKIIADKIQMLGGKRDDNHGTQSTQSKPAQKADAFSDFESDVPF
jgi:single-strand DNA-binding protein